MQNKAIQVKGLQKPHKDLHFQLGVDFGVEQGSILPCRLQRCGKITIVKILKLRSLGKAVNHGK